MSKSMEMLEMILCHLPKLREENNKLAEEFAEHIFTKMLSEVNDRESFDETLRRVIKREFNIT